MSNKKVFAFDRTNFIVLAIGMAIVIIGMVLMSGSGSDETTFNTDIFSTTRIKVAPIVCLVGYLTMAIGIILKPRDKKEEAGDEHTAVADNIQAKH